MLKIKSYITIFILLFFQVTVFTFSNVPEYQYITIDMKPVGNTKFYTITHGEDGKKGIIDLGYFNTASGQMINIPIAVVTVTIEMRDKGNSEAAKVQCSIINTTKLKQQELIFGDGGKITSFLGKGSPNLDLKISDVQIDGSQSEIVRLGLDEGEVSRFQYSFKLVADIKNLEMNNQENMYGFAVVTDKNSEAELDIKEIVLEQLNRVQS